MLSFSHKNDDDDDDNDYNKEGKRKLWEAMAMFIALMVVLVHGYTFIPNLAEL